MPVTETAGHFTFADWKEIAVSPEDAFPRLAHATVVNAFTGVIEAEATVCSYAIAYDTAAMAGQHEREAIAAERLFGLLPADQFAEFRALWDEFEAKVTPEAKFATAVDRFQPMLLNCLTQGAAWNRHGITHDRVMDRNRHIADGCADLWKFAEQMLQEAVDAGHLAK